jgi:hypothetical protein
MTAPFPDWSAMVAVRLARQGGIAAVPGLARARSIDLRECADADRRRVQAAVAAAASCAGDHCGTGDQRYFSVEIRYENHDEPMRFDVPEDEAPESLVALWREGRI